MKPPVEWLDRWVASGGSSNVVWRMKRWLYGQRKAPAAWIEWEAEVLKSEGFIRDLAALILYYNPDMDVTLEVHADDIYGCGSKETLKHLKDRLTKIVFKHFDIHQVGATYEHLRRTRVRTANGKWLQSNPKHLDKALALMNMENCKSVPTPMVQEAEGEQDQGELLNPSCAAKFLIANMQSRS